jgi:hypothetical protein
MSVQKKSLMVRYIAQNYWVSGFYPLSRILKTIKYVLETGYVSIHRWGRETPTLLGPIERPLSSD